MSLVPLLEGLAQLLAQRELGAWRPDGAAYAPGETAIVVGALPDSPPAAIALAPYGVGDDPSMSESTTGVQVRSRTATLHDPRPGLALVDGIFDALHGLDGLTLPTGVRVVTCQRQSWTPLGADDNQRPRYSQNFYVLHHRPSAHRT